MLQRSVMTLVSVDIAREHPPEKGVGSVVIDLALRVSSVQALPGGLPHHTGFDVRALIRTARLDRAVVDLLGGGCGCGALAGGVGRGHAASLRLGLGHGLSNHPPPVLFCTFWFNPGLCSRVLSSASAPPK